MSGATVAIVGAGPSGFYVADALLRRLPDCRIDLIERLPTPFGLVRGGVAPDHQGTKNVSRQFERILARPEVRFRGNVEVGRSVSCAEIRENYDVVVIATGAPLDRKLGIRGEQLPGVYGSGAFVGWYNGIPDRRDLAPLLDTESIAVIGNGNVAVDIVRILAKTREELAASDLCRHARAALERSPLRTIHLIGRRGPLQASFTAPELAELGALQRAHPVVDAGQLPAALPAELDADQRRRCERNLEVLRRFAAAPAQHKPLRVHLLFNAAPVALLGETRVTGLRLAATAGGARPAGHGIELSVGAVISAIGFRGAPLPGLPYDAERGIVRNDAGRVAPGVYAAGWCRRGAQGVIPANRSDAMALAELIVADLASLADARRRPGGTMLDALLRARGVEAVDAAGWRRIDAVETSCAAQGRPREKLTRRAELLAAARG